MAISTLAKRDRCLPLARRCGAGRGAGAGTRIGRLAATPLDKDSHRPLLAGCFHVAVGSGRFRQRKASVNDRLDFARLKQHFDGQQILTTAGGQARRTAHRSERFTQMLPGRLETQLPVPTRLC
jgi:hypothetical protein